LDASVRRITEGEGAVPEPDPEEVAPAALSTAPRLLSAEGDSQVARAALARARACVSGGGRLLDLSHASMDLRNKSEADERRAESEV